MGREDSTEFVMMRAAGSRCVYAWGSVVCYYSDVWQSQSRNSG
jgi:hypothetical protein